MGNTERNMRVRADFTGNLVAIENGNADSKEVRARDNGKGRGLRYDPEVFDEFLRWRGTRG